MLFSRRHVLTVAGQLASGLALTTALGGYASKSASSKELSSVSLLPPDGNGIRLPTGFSSRIVARSLSPVQLGDSRFLDYSWHIYPDGGAVFGQADGGWIYVSNSEISRPVAGGASALRFDAAARVVDAYRILDGTRLNCAGGPTPWGTWLSCEEVPFGYVYQCDPTGKAAAKKLPALGAFTHEAVAVDPVRRHLYLTEDEPNGRLYRFVPRNYPDLSQGDLQVATVDTTSRKVSWRTLPLSDPANVDRSRPTRTQVPTSTSFNGGEGIWYREGNIYFTTKGDNRVWALDATTQQLRILYDAANHPTPILRGVDNIVASASGKLLVAEDNGNMQLIVLDTAGNVAPLLQVDGQDESEITGPAFNPAGDRLYFSSQRGPSDNGRPFGVTYEVRGPFAELLR